MNDTAVPSHHEHYPWCLADDDDRLLRSFVFEAMVGLDIKDKLGAMKDAVHFIKTGDLPQKPDLKAVK